MIIDCISDLHGHYPKLEGGDLLIVAGDLTAGDLPYQLWNFSQWMIDQDYKCKIVISGNHDTVFYEKYYKNNENPFVPFIYLCDSGTEFEGLKIWGSPWTRSFEGMNPQCMAFTLDTEEELAEKLALIPHDIDILITHSPPYGILDQVSYINYGEEHAEHVGSHSLLYHSRMQQPRLHVFGHIHEAYGKEVEDGITSYVNASHVNENYKPVNKPIRVIL